MSNAISSELQLSIVLFKISSSMASAFCSCSSVVLSGSIVLTISSRSVSLFANQLHVWISVRLFILDSLILSSIFSTTLFNASAIFVVDVVEIVVVVVVVVVVLVVVLVLVLVVVVVVVVVIVVVVVHVVVVCMVVVDPTNLPLKFG